MADPKPPQEVPSPTPAPASEGWSGRFAEPVSPLVKRYTASVDFDRRLAAVDIKGSLAHARMLAATGVLSAADLAAIERGLGHDKGRSRARGIRLVERPRGRPLQHRKTVDGAHRRRRQEAAHRALAQRPGRHGLEAVAARGNRCAHRRARGVAPRLHRSRRSTRRDDHARLHASAGRAARHVRPPSAGVRSDVRARRRAVCRRPPAGEPAAVGERRARRHELPHRPAARRGGARVRGALHELARRRVRSRFRDRIHWPPRR